VKAPATVEEVERGFDNRAWFARWAEDSRIARESLRPLLDLRYGPNAKETLDLFVPAGRARGTLLFLHGGYWRALDKSDHALVAPVLVAEGFAVAVANYDLCPAVSIAAIVDECRRALAWIVREGGAHGADTSRIVVAGHSAGGHLAAMLMATPAEAFGTGRHPLRAAVSVSGVHDLRPLTRSSMNADLRLDDDEAARLSPVLLPPRCDAPIAIFVGADETSEFLRQSALLFDAWPRQRPEGASGPIVVPGRHHFSIVADYAERGSALTAATLSQF